MKSPVFLAPSMLGLWVQKFYSQRWGPRWRLQLKKYPLAQFEFHNFSEGVALEQIARSESHLALVSGEVPQNLGLSSKVLAEAKFQTYVGAKQSLDGWRDDQFPRKIEHTTSSLKILEQLVVNGDAIAYLPSYFCETIPIELLKVSGCPYTCMQKIKLVAKIPKDTSWLNQIF